MPVVAGYIRYSNHLNQEDIIHSSFNSCLSEAHLDIAIYIYHYDPLSIFAKMHFTLTIPIAMAAVAMALPQGPGGSRAVLGWCVSVWLLPSKNLLHYRD